ncbi:hypothetical protein CQA66_02695 [Helicobacter aurati]|uniref:Uncharacterized protein n=1 Tax=Helicobacter aurati TaxID=137778 RepID=A0A3D8J6S7_9HELI|nr:hypothetical protein [Helicobacter aurati]RDU73148.1 hypothetical protein CQA66_02695 [Helicobacter aurati]
MAIRRGRANASCSLQAELDSTADKTNFTISLVKELDSVEFNETMSFSDYVASFESYAQRNGLDLSKEPFDSLMSKTEQIALQKRIQENLPTKMRNVMNMIIS